MSEQYLVSARKYRPQTFNTVVGQNHITNTLKNAIRTEHLAHAYLFCGPRGVGKTTCARILAKTINCENPTADTEACGQCATCKSFEDSTSFNVFEMDAASNNSVDGIRALNEQVRYPPQSGKYKIYIIDEVHMLSTAAFNAFLKTLEEPPPYAIFILATTEKHKILPTILSRCQIFDFKRIGNDDIVAHLAEICAKENTQFEERALHLIAQKSEGCMRDALSMMDRIASFTDSNISYELTIAHLNILDAETYFAMVQLLLATDHAGALLQLDDLLQRGFETKTIMGGLAEHLRNLLLCQDTRMLPLLDIAREHKGQYHDQSQMTHTSWLITALKLVQDYELQHAQASNKRLQAEICLMQLAHLGQALDLGAAIANGDIKKKTLIPPPSNNVATVASSEVKKAAIIEDPKVAPIAAIPNLTETSKEPPETDKAEIETVAAEAVQEIAAAKVLAPIVAKVEEKEEAPAPEPTDIVAEPPQKNEPAETKKPKFGGVGDMLKKVRQQNDQQAADQLPSTPLTHDQLCGEVADFISELKANSEGVLAAQMEAMSFACQSDSEVTIVTSYLLQYNFANDIKDRLVERLKRVTNNPHIKVQTIFDPQATTTAPAEMVLSKRERLANMLEQSPALAAVKEKLNLQLK